MIGYYVHHQGAGHAARAASIARVIDGPVTVLTSLPRPAEMAPFADWIHLDRDDEDAAASRHDAGGALHWAPLDAPGYRARMHQLAEWLDRVRPELVVVDVSVEVTVACRLLGVPVVVVAGVGQRTDPAHQLAYRLAERIIAPWPGQLYRPAHLVEFADKTDYVGAMSRFDDQPATPRPAERRVLALFGRGGTEVSEPQLARAQRATPGWSWRIFGVGDGPWCDDVWAALSSADVVVTHAGMNMLAETAAARRPAVVLPQPRPFDEQVTTAAVLRDNGLAVVADRWPRDGEWPALLEAADRLDAGRWQWWNDSGGARRAAKSLLQIAARG